MHFLKWSDVGKKFVASAIDLGIELKKDYSPYCKAMENKSLAMLFMKTSTRTRLSFEAGMTKLGGHAIFLDVRTTNYSLGSLEDETKCVARYCDLIMARVFGHEQVEAMAKVSTVPVINGLSASYHPCQALADLMTMKEKKGSFDGMKIAFVGDGNNVCNSLIEASEMLGIEIAVATPKGFEPKEKAKKLQLTNDPVEAVKDADFVYTDTWISMGQEADTESRKTIFPPFQVNSVLMKHAKPSAFFLHCLPAHRGLEVSDEVMDSKQSIIFDQAENRMHAQAALMLKLLKLD